MASYERRSRTYRFLHRGPRSGRFWFQWALLSHLMLVCAPIGLVSALRAGDREDYGWLGVLTLGAAVSTVAFWYAAGRVWRTLPDAVDPPARPEPDRPGSGTVRRLS